MYGGAGRICPVNIVPSSVRATTQKHAHVGAVPLVKWVVFLVEMLQVRDAMSRHELPRGEVSGHEVGVETEEDGDGDGRRTRHTDRHEE